MHISFVSKAVVTDVIDRPAQIGCLTETAHSFTPFYEDGGWARLFKTSLA